MTEGRKHNAIIASERVRCAFSWVVPLLIPNAETGNELQVVGVFALRTRQVGRAAETLVPNHTDVWRELAPDLVTQPQTYFGIG